MYDIARSHWQVVVVEPAAWAVGHKINRSTINNSNKNFAEGETVTLWHCDRGINVKKAIKSRSKLTIAILANMVAKVTLLWVLPVPAC